MRLPNLLFLLLVLLVCPALSIGSSQPTAATSASSHADAYAQAHQLANDFVDALYQVHALTKHTANVNAQERARDDDDGGDGDGDTSKLINQLASTFRPVMKQFILVVNTILPAGPQRQLVKAAADAVDSLLPLILKYALGL